MKNNWMKKGSVVTVILLFIGVAVAPSINQSVVKASDDNDLVEVTTQACGIQGFGNTTVKLTRQQYQNLEEYLVDFRERLNQTATRGEAVPIFKDAVVELNRYGLLPKGMSVERAERLVTGYGKSTNVVNRIHSSEGILNCSNLFCLIAGKATYCLLASPIITGLRDIIWILYERNSNSNVIFTLWEFISMLLVLRNDFPSLSGKLSFFSVLSLLTFGATGYYIGTQASDGWIFTVGLLGIRSYNGSFFGKIHYPVESYFVTLYTGAFGFTGFKIMFPDYSFLFLGTALRVNIDNTPPSYP